jgi:anti-sigma B factor antagonist
MFKPGDWYFVGMHALSDPAAPFSVDVEFSDSAATARLAGELDIATAEMLKQALASIELKAGDRLVIDLSAVGFMDSTGLRLLITAQRNAAENDYSLTVVTGDSPAKRVLELTRMDEHIDVVASLD